MAQQNSTDGSGPKEEKQEPPDRLNEDGQRSLWLSLQQRGLTPAMARLVIKNGQAAQAMVNAVVIALDMVPRATTDDLPPGLS